MVFTRKIRDFQWRCVTLQERILSEVADLSGVEFVRGDFLGKNISKFSLENLTVQQKCHSQWCFVHPRWWVGTLGPALCRVGGTLGSFGGVLWRSLGNTDLNRKYFGIFFKHSGNGCPKLFFSGTILEGLRNLHTSRTGSTSWFLVDFGG